MISENFGAALEPEELELESIPKSSEDSPLFIIPNRSISRSRFLMSLLLILSAFFWIFLKFFRSLAASFWAFSCIALAFLGFSIS